MTLETEQRKLQKTYRLHLNAIKNKHRLADKEIALMMGLEVTNADLVRKMRAGQAKIQTCRIIQLSKNLIQEYQDSSLLQEMVPDEYMAYAVSAGAANGRIDDEINNITYYSGKILGEIRKNQPINTASDPQVLRSIQDSATRIAAEAAMIREEAK